MNDKFYLDAEYDTISHYSNTSLEELNHFSKLAKAVLSHGNKFHLSIKSTLDSFLDESMAIDPKTQLSHLLKMIYQSSSNFLNKTKKILDSFHKEIIDPIDQYKAQLKFFYEDTLGQFEKINKTIKEADKKVEKLKQKYYDSCRLEYKFEKESNKESVQLGQDSNDTLLKLKSKKENDCQLYKYEISNANKCYSEFNKKYDNIMQTLKMSEETRLNYFKEHINNYIKSLNDFSNNSIEMTETMNSKLSSWKLEKDLELFVNEIQFYSDEKGIRIPNEVFALLNNKNINETISTQVGSNQIKSLFNKGRELISAFGDYEFIDVNHFNYDHKTKQVETFFLMLLTDNEVQSDMMTELMSFLSESAFPQVFITIFKEKQKSAFLHITNNKNLTHLANLFNTIFLNSLIDKDMLNGLILYILFLAQRTYTCIEKKHKIFLCGILGKNKIFQTKKFWCDLIEFKLKTNLASSKRKLEENYQQMLKEENDQNASNSGFFGMVGKSLYTIANNTISNTLMTEIKMKEAVNPFAQLMQFPNFYLLPPKLKTNFIDKGNGELQRLIYNFIPYYANFSFGTGNSIDFIVELGNKYSVSNDVINYYVICLNTASYSIRQKHIEDVILFKDKHRYYNKEIKNNRISVKYNGILKAKDEDKILLLEEIIKFLDSKALLNLLLLSKRSSRILSKKIYKDCLNRKGLNIKSRLGIWSVLLKTSEIKKKYEYKTLNKIANNVQYTKNSNSPLSIIDCDVKRTLFDNNIEENRQIISRILKTIAYLLKEITYCQGLNFIIKFIYLLCNDEEEAFYLMMGLLVNTDFSSIFLNELEKLKDNFTIFDKLLGLYLPVIQYFFTSNNVMPNYYLASWFITLFTFSIKKDNRLHALVKIWDNFLLFGWKTVLYTSLIVLENQEDRIIKMKMDNLLEYLIEAIINNDFYYEYELFITRISKCSLSNQLIQNLENEVIQEKTIKLGKKK